MNLRPLDDKIVIKKIEMEERTASGIVLPSSAKEESNVVFSKYAGSEIELEKEKFTIIKFADVLAVIE